ncbi:hypothetical protein LSH36_217g01052 [Paralvinella palmiformis]|uniref:Uncharacterized protein n=1 Tax=Paralvinella palmiformis TaxID=53620 RepID=A0AAD9JQG4_9ANNE|nr:hypothetical protein LSH36_217g01052 [Paralvinella palmiformis]
MVELGLVIDHNASRNMDIITGQRNMTIITGQRNMDIITGQRL